MDPIKLSTRDARRLALANQALLARNQFGRGPDATRAAIRHLGYVQLDTLSVVARAHEHTLWNRLPAFRASHINKLQCEGVIFEHWAHALALLPMEDYRYSIPMMERIASGQVHWYKKDKKATDCVLARIRAEGPLTSRDFEDRPEQKEMWARSASKRALEQLFMEGELMIPERQGFQKVYDLRERVLPDWVDSSTPGDEEFARHLVKNHLRAHGFGTAKQIAYLRKGMRAKVRQTLQELEEDDEVIPVQIKSDLYYASPALFEQLQQPLPKAGFRILSPFDNAIIQRQRTQDLFDFDYQIECYVKKENRRYGYFCLPLLYRNQLVGRLDAKADRQQATLQLLHLHLEDNLGDRERFYRSFIPELNRFAAFNNCEQIQLLRITGCDVGERQLRSIATKVR